MSSFGQLCALIQMSLTGVYIVVAIIEARKFMDF